MSRVKMGTLVIAFVLGFATAGWTQGMGGGMGRQMPRMLGAFKPVVGSGAQYEMTMKDRTMHSVYAVVGQEVVEGNTGYWMEIRTEGAGMPGEMVMKQLMVLGGDRPQIKRMIMQSPGHPPMEMPVGMMQGMGQRGRPPQQGDSSPGEIVGSETITVPAGTFECEHYRKQEPHGTVDVLDIRQSFSLRDGEDVHRGDDDGAGKSPQQRNHPHQRRAPEDGYAISAPTIDRVIGRSGDRETGRAGRKFWLRSLFARPPALSISGCSSPDLPYPTLFFVRPITRSCRSPGPVMSQFELPITFGVWRNW